MSHHTLIKDGHLIDHASKLDKIADLFIIDDKIAGIATPPVSFKATQTIDAKGLMVCPGLVDLCARLREPGDEYRATLISELQAAVAGGVTSLACPPDTAPVLDEPGLIEMLKHRTKQLNLASVYPIGALTCGLKGEKIAELNALAEAGCVGFTQAGFAIPNTQVLWRAMQYAATFGLTVFLNAQDHYLAEDGVVHDGEVATRLGLKGIPSAAETIALAVILQVAKATHTRLHISQLSTAEGIEMVRQAKADGLNITCDVDVMHLHLTELDIGFFNTACHVSPPLRTLRDQAAISQGLVDGTIDAICSNHAPVDEDAKQVPFAQSEVGSSMIELLLPLTIKWANNHSIDLIEALAKLSHHPAKILNRPTTQLSIGQDADLCLFNDSQWIVKPERLRSQGKDTPFQNMEMPATVIHTLVAGSLVYSAQSI